MKTNRRLRLLGTLCLLAGWSALAGCHRTPQTAGELATVLPRHYAGALHWQGDFEQRTLSIAPLEVGARSEHVLEFSGVAYEVRNPQGSVLAKGDAPVHGTITVPGFEIKLEDLGGVGGGDEAMRVNTFTGKLNSGLRSMQASWTTGLGQKASLDLRATSP